MDDHRKTREELIRELSETRRQNAELQKTVSRIKKEDEILRMSNENYNIHFTMANDVMFSYDHQFRILSITPNVERLLGYKSDEMIGRNFQSLGVLDPIDLNEATEDALLVLSGKPIFYSIYQFITKDGEKKFGEVSGVPIKKEGKVVGSISVARDITQRVLAQEELDKYRDHLEVLVKERTDELTAVNEQLRQEIAERRRSEQALKESKEFIRGITENLPGVVYQFYARDNGEMGLNYVSGHTQELLGLNIEPLEDFFQRFTACVAPEDRDSLLTSVQEAVHNNSNWEHEVRFIKPSGEELYIRGISTLRQLEDELVFDGVLLDITKRRLAEKALAESEVRYRFLTENMNDIVWTADLDFNVTYDSPAVERVLGFTVNERMTQEAQRMMTPESYTKVLKTLSAELQRDNEPGVDPYRSVKLELEYYHKNGSTVWMECVVTAIRDDSGKIIGIHGVSRDITDRRHAESALAESEKRFRTLIQKSLDMIMILDRNGFMVYETPSLESILGYQPGYLIGKSPFEFVHPDDIKRVANDLNEVYLKTNPGIPTELRCRKADGTWVYLEVIGQNLLEDPAINGIVLTARDISERKRAEEELKKYRDHLEEVVQERNTDLETKEKSK
ncbi:MAG TPA: PAS domain S-box protein [Desulfomonilia bacterium]|nr:PAS domain S-box protein [Desulfomonilia bacterium]